jgi:hypothetical protein
MGHLVPARRAETIEEITDETAVEKPVLRNRPLHDLDFP